MSRRTIAWLLLLGTAGSLYLFENNAGTLSVLLCAALPPLLGLVFLAAGGKTAAEAVLPGTVEKGREITGKLSVQNGGWLPIPNLQISWTCRNEHTGQTLSGTHTLSLGPRGRAELPFQAVFHQCGRVRFALTGAETGDLFGLFHRRLTLTGSWETTVLPELFAPEVRLLAVDMAAAESQNDSQTRPGGDPGEIFAIREYVPGDPVRQIHWKLSEKTGKTMLRQFGLPIVAPLLLIFDPAGGDPTVTDALTEIVCSLIEALSAQGVAFDVAWTDGETGEAVVEPVLTPEDAGPLMGRPFPPPVLFRRWAPAPTLM